MDGRIILFAMLIAQGIVCAWLAFKPYKKGEAATMNNPCPNSDLPAHKAGSRAGECSSCKNVNAIANDLTQVILNQEAKSLHRAGCICHLCKPPAKK